MGSFRALGRKDSQVPPHPNLGREPGRWQPLAKMSQVWENDRSYLSMGVQSWPGNKEHGLEKQDGVEKGGIRDSYGVLESKCSLRLERPW